jgi:hypothetical protein
MTVLLSENFNILPLPASFIPSPSPLHRHSSPNSSSIQWQDYFLRDLKEIFYDEIATDNTIVVGDVSLE